MQARIPRPIAGNAGTPFATASFVMTIWPNAITVPQERSMPAVRITSVCPIARTPTTITCCITSERFCACRKRSLFSEKNAIVRRSATNGPSPGAAAAPRRRSAAERRGGRSGAAVVSVVVTLA